MFEALTYDQVNLIPKYSQLESRSLADTSVDLCGWKFKLPVVPANMEDVIDANLSFYLSESGYFYIMHRFNLDNFIFVKCAQNWKLISISTGVNNDSLDELERIKEYNYRVDFITIDVAHGHHIKVKNRIKWLKENFPNTKIIAGNIATSAAIDDLVEWGADVLKIGIGQGSICTTRFQTGFSMPMFSCISSVGRDYRTPVIADGGLKYIGDIPKALVAGATMVMSGKLFASCLDSPAEVIGDHKQYRGSTSFAAKKHNKHIEGKIIELEADITIAERLTEIQEALQSAISYAGGHNLEAFKFVDYCIVNNN